MAFDNLEEVGIIKERCDALETRLAALENLLLRGFGQMVNSTDPATRMAGSQVVQTLRGQQKRANRNSR